MPINGGTIADGGTPAAATGGTVKTYTAGGQSIMNGIQVIDPSVTDFRIRPNATFKTANAKLSPLGKWSKGKRSVTYVIPKVLSDGTQAFPLVRISLEDHPEMTEAEILRLLSNAAQLLYDADFQAFWKTGSTL